jgi:hypothetical protein
MDDRRIEIRFLVGEGRDYSLLHSVQTGSGAESVPEALSPGVKRQGREADHSPPSRAEVKNGGAVPPLSHMSSWHDG